jgi:hypothetical protein
MEPMMLMVLAGLGLTPATNTTFLQLTGLARLLFCGLLSMQNTIPEEVLIGATPPFEVRGALLALRGGESGELEIDNTIGDRGR